MSDEMPERTYLRMHAWQIQPGTIGDTEYIRDDLVAAKDAEIERLNKCLDQAISLANIRLEHRNEHGDPEGDTHRYVCCDSCGTPFLSALADHLELKEKKNANPKEGE